MRKILRILSNGAKFSAGRPLLPEYTFSATMASTSSTYPLGAVTSLNFFPIENMPRITGKVAHCRLGNARRAALVAVLADNIDTRLVLIWL